MGGCVIIVEGKTDKERLLQVLAEPVTILCTYGTYSPEKGEELVRKTEDAEEVYIFTDEDDSGKKLRMHLMEEIPHAIPLRTQKAFAEVANTPLPVLAEIMERAGLAVASGLLDRG
ncbi:toprim domain-containing protein [Brevibacillus sp. GCM10020057]|uniref:toprim domain-containing protein n=1 Tax=Brevibacillus sp. GCM10020057 TaxID=3317327 RepID=UPI0036388E53